jgi:hypothetical protein
MYVHTSIPGAARRPLCGWRAISMFYAQNNTPPFFIYHKEYHTSHHLEGETKS